MRTAGWGGDGPGAALRRGKVACVRGRREDIDSLLASESPRRRAVHYSSGRHERGDSSDLRYAPATPAVARHCSC